MVQSRSMGSRNDSFSFYVIFMKKGFLIFFISLCIFLLGTQMVYASQIFSDSFSGGYNQSVWTVSSPGIVASSFGITPGNGYPSTWQGIQHGFSLSSSAFVITVDLKINQSSSSDVFPFILQNGGNWWRVVLGGIGNGVAANQIELDSNCGHSNNTATYDTSIGIHHFEFDLTTSGDITIFEDGATKYSSLGYFWACGSPTSTTIMFYHSGSGAQSELANYQICDGSCATPTQSPTSTPTNTPTPTPSPTPSPTPTPLPAGSSDCQYFLYDQSTNGGTSIIGKYHVINSSPLAVTRIDVHYVVNPSSTSIQLPNDWSAYFDVPGQDTYFRGGTPLKTGDIGDITISSLYITNAFTVDYVQCTYEDQSMVIASVPPGKTKNPTGHQLPSGKATCAPGDIGCTVSNTLVDIFGLNPTFASNKFTEVQTLANNKVPFGYINAVFSLDWSPITSSVTPPDISIPITVNYHAQSFVTHLNWTDAGSNNIASTLATFIKNLFTIALWLAFIFYLWHVATDLFKP